MYLNSIVLIMALEAEWCALKFCEYDLNLAIDDYVFLIEKSSYYAG